MIPEWLSFGNKCRSRVKFALHSDNKIERLGVRPSRSRGFLGRSDKRAPLTPHYTICGFQFGTKFLFSLLDIRMKFRTRTRISFGMTTEMSLLRTDLYRNEISFRYHVSKHRILYGDGMNSSQNESHSGIMWIAPEGQKISVDGSHEQILFNIFY